jgi:glucose-1-phosphate adenylyltransferase
MRDQPDLVAVFAADHVYRMDVAQMALTHQHNGADTASDGETDFSRHLLPRAITAYRVLAYDFSDNRVTGTLPQEKPNDWRDVGAIAACRAAQQGALGGAPKFDLDNAQWPIGRRGKTRPHADVATGPG